MNTILALALFGQLPMQTELGPGALDPLPAAMLDHLEQAKQMTDAEKLAKHLRDIAAVDAGRTQEHVLSGTAPEVRAGGAQGAVGDNGLA